MADTEVPAGQVEANGRRYMTDARGALVPLELVKGQDRDQDAAVRRLFAAADEVAAILGVFKAEAFDQVDQLQASLADQYQARIGGEKGNITLLSFDGLMKIQVQVADRKTFGPELQTAKTLIDECIAEWSADSQAELRAIVMNAFDVEREGQINRSALLGLLRLDIKDARWLRAMQAIRDAEKVIGSARFIRFYRRPTTKGQWEPVPLDLATV